MATIHSFSVVQWYAIIIFIIGFLLRYIIAKRRFNRRMSTGLAYFSSYERGVVTTLLEMILRLLAGLMILGAIFLFLVEVYNKHTEQKQARQTHPASASTALNDPVR